MRKKYQEGKKILLVFLIPLGPNITSLSLLSQFPIYFTPAICNHAFKTLL